MIGTHAIRICTSPTATDSLPPQQGLYHWHYWDISSNDSIMKRKIVDTLLLLPSARYEQGFVLANMADNNNDDDSVATWRHKSRLLRLIRRPWITSSACWLNSWSIRTTRRIPTTMNEKKKTRLQKQKCKEVFFIFNWCQVYQRHPGSDCIPNPKRWTEESRDDLALLIGMRFSHISIKVQATYVAYVRW